VVTSKAANGGQGKTRQQMLPEQGSFILFSPGPASLFLFSSFVLHISGYGRGVGDGRAWR
jgi:hypothetical protein